VIQPWNGYNPTRIATTMMSQYEDMPGSLPHPRRKSKASGDAIFRVRYAHNPDKLAGWLTASHLERAPQAKKKNGEPNAPR
jgi:hypothetical protein